MFPCGDLFISSDQTLGSSDSLTATSFMIVVKYFSVRTTDATAPQATFNTFIKLNEQQETKSSTSHLNMQPAGFDASFCYNLHDKHLL